jgi:hypothetical protein
MQCKKSLYNDVRFGPHVVVMLDRYEHNLGLSDTMHIIICQNPLKYATRFGRQNMETPRPHYMYQ